MAELVTTIDFKSVGSRPAPKKTADEILNRVPIGVKTPMRLGNNEIWEMNHTLSSEINQNLKDLLATNWGERLGRYNFGANLRPLLFEFSRDEFDSEVSFRIKDAVSKWMPYITLKSMERKISEDDVGNVAIVTLNILYDVPQAALKNQAVRTNLFVSG